MARTTATYECEACGATSPRWVGRCPACGEWNRLVEHSVERPPSRPGPTAAELDRLVLPLHEVTTDAAGSLSTGVTALDRVMSGGVLPGSVTLLGGEPGIGKSTLLLQAISAVASRGERTLLVAAEESAEQVRRRAARLGPLPPDCFVCAATDLEVALGAAGHLRPALLVVDSIQAVATSSSSAAPGSIGQVRECAQLLARHAKSTGLATVLVGHVTKDGALAGPRTLEHLVDTVLAFEGDRHHALRTLVALKHRFGPTGELGLLEMGEHGLTSVDDPSALLFEDRRPQAAGSALFPLVEGRRPLLVEVQALVASAAGAPRRVANGASGTRLAMLLAVLERCCGTRFGSLDVFVSTVGGIRATEPALDLPLVLAVCSALVGVPLPDDLACFGEVGLTGELRRVERADRRLAEAARLGIGRAIVPAGSPEGPASVRLDRVGSVREALLAVGLSELVPARPAGRPASGRGGAGHGGRTAPAGAPHLAVLAPLSDDRT